MAVDAAALAAEPSGQADPPDRTSSTEPAAPSGPSLGTLRDAFRADADGSALKANSDRGGREQPPEGDAPPEGSAAPPDGDAASKSGGERVQQPDSRRGAASALADKDAEIERLVAERQAEQARTAAAEAALARVNQQHAKAQQAILDEIGDDAEFEQLQLARLHNQTLTYAQNQKLDRMLVARGEAAGYWELADRGHKAMIARGLGSRVEKYGLDRDRAFGSDLGELIDHAVGVTEARVRAESADRIASLEAELKGLRPRAAAARVTPPTSGGASAPAGTATPPDGASPLEFFRAGARQHEAAAAARGARR